jgi:hypothetical protein
VVNLLGVSEPMVGWKRAPLLVVASRYLILISIFLLYVLNWNNGGMYGFIYMCIYKWFSVWNGHDEGSDPVTERGGGGLFVWKTSGRISDTTIISIFHLLMQTKF